MTSAALQPQPPERDDAELFAAYQAGDEAAFAVLWARWSPRVTAYAARLLGRREAAEEVCTETFVRLVEGRWRPTGSFGSFLFTVAHRQCLDRLRKHQRHARLLSLLTWRSVSERTPEDLVAVDERDAGLARAVARLSEGHRAVVLLTYTEGLSSAEVATILGCTDQQVRSKLAYAKKLLRQHLEDPDA